MSKRLIYAEDVLQILDRDKAYMSDVGRIHAKNAVNEAPTVEQKKGRWHIDDYDSGDPGYYSAFIEVHCSECGYEVGAESGQYGWFYGDPFPWNFCPNCGADMRGEEDDT